MKSVASDISWIVYIQNTQFRSCQTLHHYMQVFIFPSVKTIEMPVLWLALDRWKTSLRDPVCLCWKWAFISKWSYWFCKEKTSLRDPFACVVKGLSFSRGCEALACSLKETTGGGGNPSEKGKWSNKYIGSHRRTRWGGRGSCSPPQNLRILTNLGKFGGLRFFWANFGKV